MLLSPADTIATALYLAENGHGFMNSCDELNRIKAVVQLLLLLKVLHTLGLAHLSCNVHSVINHQAACGTRCNISHDMIHVVLRSTSATLSS